MKNIFKVHDCYEMLSTEVDKELYKYMRKMRNFIMSRRNDGVNDKSILDEVLEAIDSSLS